MFIATPIRRGLIVAFMAAVFLWPFHSVHAQENNLVPEFNPLCWKLDDCARARAKLGRMPYEQMSDDQKKAGWVTGETPCNQEGWGKCLPAGMTRTEIIFGGKQQFANVGEFIQVMYRYAVGVASVLSVIMIIVAGFQYATSGGNSEALTSAKKRMAGAFSGLILAFLSYAILTLINPALTRFRLPQIWMIREQHLVPQFCGTSPSSTFAFAAEKDNQSSKPTGAPDFTKGIQYQGDDIKQFECGRRFYIKDGGGQTCFGDVCSSGQMCANVDYSGNLGSYNCIQANILGRITNDKGLQQTGCLAGLTPFGTNGWETPEIVDTAIFNNDSEQELWMVCKDNSMHEVTGEISKIFTFPKYQSYYITLALSQIEAAANGCSAKGGEKGFVIKFEMNTDCSTIDQDHWIGYDGVSGGSTHETVDLGDTTFFKNNTSLAQYAQNIKDQYFIPSAVMKKGIILNMDATKVHAITGNDDRNQIYQSLMK